MRIQTVCDYPFNRVRVTAEGDVAFCCFMRPDPAFPGEPYIGNVLKNTFDEVWFGDVAESIRQHVVEGRLHKLCQVPGCPFMYMDGHKSGGLPKHELEYNEYPIFLEIDLPNTHCNVGLEDPNENHPACIMCERAGPKGEVFKPQQDHLLEVMERITYLMPNLQQIHIQGIAEPFYKDIIFDMLGVLDFDKYKHKIMISTTTNGTLLNKDRRSKFLRLVRKSILNFSIDAATPETFRKIRILPLFEDVLENLYAYNKERNKDRQFLRIMNNINIHNVHEVRGMCQIAKKAEVNLVEFSPTDGWNEDILVNEDNCGLFKRAHFDIEDECQRLGVPFNIFRPLDLGITDKLIQITI